MIITRYLTREVISSLLLVTIVLLLALLSQQVVRYLNYVAVGKIPTSILLQLISFEVPYLLAVLLPLCLYLGILLAYGRLYSDSEMAVLQLCGYGYRRLFWLTALIGLAIAIIVFVLMMWVNPFISAKRQLLIESDEATVHLVQTLIPGRFQVSADGRHVLYVENLSRNHKRASNVFLAEQAQMNETTQPIAWKLILAESGYQENDKKNNEQFFVTTNGYRYEGMPGENEFKVTKFTKYAVRIPASNVQAIHQEDETLSLMQLIKGYSNPKQAAELQWRISVALSAFLLALLAVPLSVIKPRRSKYVVLFPAILIYIVYLNLLFIARHWVEQESVSINLGMWWVHGLIALFVLILIILNMTKWK